MGLPPELLSELEDVPRELERALRLIPGDRLGWKPVSWAGNPAENFSALEHVCHLRAGEFAEYGRLTLRALIHYLRSHDQQHLAGIQFLAGKIASDAASDQC